ncbi:hypothetical protein L6164_008871 [Bauhinia variegata]|uniref:Uncharacterized protein n=1 Tax=Bauhinia variegata TaxID=167791 RepID=A0ACB9PNL9_BAUVA|nr:hypothetical protein L6164_008871 [Bauhinia variegata]
MFPDEGESLLRIGKGNTPILIGNGLFAFSFIKMASTKLSIKLLIDTTSQRVLFAEAGKDFIDFLFSLLSLPMGTVYGLLIKQDMGGSIGNIYESIENLNETYIQPNKNKDILLKQSGSFSASEISLLMSPATDGTVNLEPETWKLFMCSRRCTYRVAHDRTVICPSCHAYLDREVEYFGSEGGFVKGGVTYMVMDDLVVQPMSTISGIALLRKFKIKDVGSLQEKIVDFGMDEGLKLLKASLECNTVLSTVLL